MTRLSLGLVSALSGCCLFNPSFRTPDRPGETVEAIPPALDRFPYCDLSNARPGEWAAYRERDGSTWTIKVLSVGERVTVELLKDDEVVQQKIRPPDRVEASYLWRKKVYKQEIEQSPGAAPAETRSEPPETSDSDATVSGRRIATKKIRRSSADSEGVVTEEEYEFSAQVPRLFTRVGDPVIDALIAGGLVRVNTPRRQVELVDFGSDARGTFKIPE